MMLRPQRSRMFRKMATYTAIRRALLLTGFGSNSCGLSMLRVNWTCNRYRNIFTMSAVRASDSKGFGMDENEQSWVRKMLYGSGPSAELEELEEEEEVVGVEPRYMDILQEKPSFIEKPEVRKQVYRPPPDLSDVLRNITVEVCQVSAASDWQQVPLSDNEIKYKVLSRCSEALRHDVPNFLLNQMKKISDVLAFYQEEVKDTSKFDELVAQELPDNLRIYWDYKDDSKLEIYQDYLDYIEPRFNVRSKDMPKVKYV